MIFFTLFVLSLLAYACWQETEIDKENARQQRIRGLMERAEERAQFKPEVV